MTKKEMTIAASVVDTLKGMCADDFAQDLFECAINGAHGVYVGQRIGEMFGHLMPDLSQEDRLILCDSEHEYYCDVWSDADQLDIKAPDGSIHNLYTTENGDVMCYAVKDLELWESVNDADFWEELNA